MGHMGAWVDTFLEDLLRRGKPAGGPREERAVPPPVDIHETAEHWVILADMPGVDEKGVAVTLEENQLMVTGRPAPLGLESLPAHGERATGPFRRRFALGEGQVDAERIRAVIKNGVLRVTLPKAGPAKAHRIDVKGE